jgi:monoterpene epsilon-lactone hydrolase
MIDQNRKQMKIFLNFFLKIIGAGNLLNSIAKAGTNDEKFNRIISRNRRVDVKRPPKLILENYNVSEFDVEGYPLFMMKNRNKSSEKIIFYFHGGAYVVGPNLLQWLMVKNLASTAGSDFALLNYPKIPEAQAIKTMKVSIESYKIIADRYGANNIIFLGDSAGAGLALALVMELDALGENLPENLVLFSPWLDVSMDNPESQDYDKNDVLLNCTGLKLCGYHYAGDLDLHHPWVSPFYGNLDNLPPATIFASTSEVFWPDIRNFCRKANSIGRNIELITGQGLPHDYPLLYMFPEGKKALEYVKTII